jgi:hypothetical protein
MESPGGLVMERLLSASSQYFRKDQKRSSRDFFLSRELNMTHRTSGALFFMLILTAACGSDNSTGPARAHFTSTLTAAKCASNGKYSLTANWQAVGTWQAVFTSETGATAVSETSPVDANQTKTSSCLFTPGTMVYAILLPVTVVADADATPTISLP